jgi:mannosyltransferase
MLSFAAIGLRMRGGRDWWQDNRASLALPAAIGALALLLRLHGLGDKPFWLDEVATLRRATATIPDLVLDSLHNNHYPSYFLMLWVVAKIGTSQWLLRLPSAVFGAIAASLTCAIGRSVKDSRSGAVAGLLMAFSPFEVQFGQEARSYTLVACLILIALSGLVRLAQEPAAAALPFRRGGASRGAWIAYGLGTAAALDVLNVAVPWLIAANLGAIAIARSAGNRRGGFWRNWGLTQLFILAAWAPLLAAVYVASKGAVLDRVGWAPAASAETIWAIVAPVYLLRLSNFITLDLAPAVVPGLSLAVVVLAALGVWRMRREPTVLAVLGSAALVLPLGLCVVSLFVPVLVPRYFAWSAAPFFIFAGTGLGLLSGARFAALATALGAVCLVNLIPYYGYETKPRWDLVATKLAAIAHPGDVVLVDSYYAYSVLSVFAARVGLDVRHVKLTWLLPEAAKAAPGHDVWAVYGRTGQMKKRTPEDYRRSLFALGGPIAVNVVGRYILLWRFRVAKLPERDEEAGGYCRIEQHGR